MVEQMLPMMEQYDVSQSIWRSDGYGVTDEQVNSNYSFINQLIDKKNK